MSVNEKKWLVMHVPFPSLGVCMYVMCCSKIAEAEAVLVCDVCNLLPVDDLVSVHHKHTSSM